MALAGGTDEPGGGLHPTPSTTAVTSVTVEMSVISLTETVVSPPVNERALNSVVANRGSWHQRIPLLVSSSIGPVPPGPTGMFREVGNVKSILDGKSSGW